MSSHRLINVVSGTSCGRMGGRILPKCKLVGLMAYLTLGLYFLLLLFRELLSVPQNSCLKNQKIKKSKIIHPLRKIAAHSISAQSAINAYSMTHGQPVHIYRHQNLGHRALEWWVDKD